MKTLKASAEFVVGKHNIGWVSSDFTKTFSDESFEKGTMPTFQKLGRNMTDAQIEKGLKVGLCDLGSILAFLDEAPDECKDGWYNLFYTPAFVVDVRWRDGAWNVIAWPRGGYAWRASRRVFSPANLESKTLNTSDTLTLESFDSRLKKLEALFNPELLK